jgi:nicotinamide mononucleotide (NMN) deamidase PncC
VSRQQVKWHGEREKQAMRISALASPELQVQGGDSSNLPAGLIYIALADKDRTFVDKLITGRSNDREYNRYVASSYALNMARLYLEGFWGGLYG